MDKVRRSVGGRSFVHYCVLQPGDVIKPDASAIETHATAAFIYATPGTFLSECTKRIRAVSGVGYAAKIFGLDPEVGGWLAMEPELLTYALQEDDNLHLKIVVTSDVVDLSVEWARTVLQPFPYSVVELPGLRKALAEPLLLPLPIGDSTCATLKPEVARHFVPSKLYSADAVSPHTTSFMRSNVTPGMSENLLQSIWDQAFSTLWMDVLPLVELVSVHFNRNVTNHSGASTASTRPDLMLWILNRLCVKFEEKRDTLSKALNDLIKKICVLPKHYYGPVQWIIGVALARNDMAVWALRQGQQPDNLSGCLSMSSQEDKVACLRLSINFLRVALSLSSIYGKLTYLPMPFTELGPCSYGSADQITRRLKINYPRVEKVIQPWSEHVGEGFTTLEYVTKAYAAAAGANSGLIKGNVETVRGDKYKVVLTPVGFEQLISGENELQVAIRDVLKGLRVLHAAGLVHRDIRWKNILNTEMGQWMLIDLETVWERDHEPQCWLHAWNDQTLVRKKYTEQSDLYLLGKLMDTVPKLSTGGTAFQFKLLNRHFSSADQVLQDNYLSI